MKEVDLWNELDGFRHSLGQLVKTLAQEHMDVLALLRWVERLERLLNEHHACRPEE